ncbi:hypothetical protein CQA01_30240 [Cyclobacterium qasimii]|uniref:Uncharacterized protein n=1 Tax=Cyclobacterium qasimii TaxID=1350429 RepID=A0A512CEL3_9BACT|nr:hypothetical protein CQA01_30240 [Cyclobacterium qasimii]
MVENGDTKIKGKKNKTIGFIPCHVPFGFWVNLIETNKALTRNWQMESTSVFYLTGPLQAILM